MLAQRMFVSVVTLSAIVAVGLPSTAWAQRDAGAKMRGEYNFYGRSAGSSMRGARDYSNYYREYAQGAPEKQVNPEVAREAADAIGTYITKARRHFAWMRTQAEGAKDQETLVSLDLIDKHLATAAKSHHEMHETCLKANVEAAGSMKCCQEIDDELAAAIAEHDKLMKRLAGDKAPASKK